MNFMIEEQMVSCKQKKIAILCTPVEYGGAERVVLSIIENISVKELKIIPILFIKGGHGPNVLVEKITELGIKHYRIVVNRCKYKFINPVLNLIALWQIAKNEKFDLIHTHGYRADILAWALSLIINSPMISTIHGFILNDKKLALYKAIDIFALKKFNYLLPVSAALKKELIKYGIKKNKIEVLPNAVRLENSKIKNNVYYNNIKKKIKTNKNTTTVGYIGRLSIEKGCRYLIKAVSILTENEINIKLVIVGDGPDRKNLETLINKHNLKTQVIFTGFQTDIAGIFKVFDIFVLPSLTEGAPMALLEAMSFEKAVIASAVGEIPKIINDMQNGILIKAKDPLGIADAIMFLIGNEKKKIEMQRNAKLTVIKKYNLNNWIERIIKIYQAISK